MHELIEHRLHFVNSVQSPHIPTTYSFNNRRPPSLPFRRGRSEDLFLFMLLKIIHICLNHLWYIYGSFTKFSNFVYVLGNISYKLFFFKDICLCNSSFVCSDRDDCDWAGGVEDTIAVDEVPNPS